MDDLAVACDRIASYNSRLKKVGILADYLRELPDADLERAVRFLATGTPHDVIRQANNRVGDLARIAVAARAGNVHEIEARLFHPMDFMLAKPLEALKDLPDPENWWVEDKYDGIRSQVHFDHGRV